MIKNSVLYKKVLLLSMWFMLLIAPSFVFASSLDTPFSAENINSDYQLIGHAFDLKSKELVYTERHYIHSDSSEFTRRVEYLDANNDVIVIKQLNYDGVQIAPEFTQKDLRTGNQLSARFKGRKLLLSRSNKKGEIRYSELKKTNTLVVDAGFDAYIRQYWELLLNGKSLQFDFAVPTRGTAVKMITKNIKTKECEKVTGEYSIVRDMDNSQSVAQEVCFKLIAKNWLLRKILQPIYIAYDKDTRKLLAFKGLSDIRSENNKSLRVFIRYEYL